MGRPRNRCAVCEGRESPLVAVSVEGRRLFLCAAHAAELGAEPPSTLVELDRLLGDQDLERRAIPDRRQGADRRVLPPRPERRRHNLGRRQSDPRY